MVATAAGVVFVLGLMALNWRKDTPPTNAELAEMDLPELNVESGFNAPRVGGASELHRPRDVVNDQALSSAQHFGRTVAGPHLPPLGLVTQTGKMAESSGIQTAAAFVPAAASRKGSQGALLTGQIEVESPPRSSDSTTRPSRNYETR